MTAPRTRFGVSYARSRQATEPHRGAKSARIFLDDLPDRMIDADAFKRAYADGVRTFVVSFKSTAGVAPFMASKPRGTRVYGCWVHEPENDVEDGRLTLAGWRAETRRLAPIMRRRGVVPTVILMSWTLQEASGRDVDDYLFSSRTIGALGVDCYLREPGPIGAKLAPILALRRRTGLPLLIPETAVDADYPDRAAVTRRWRDALAGRARVACWWDDVGEKVDGRLDGPTARAFLGAP